MDKQKTKLLLACGKIASGKSTLLSKLSSKHEAILISQDQWMATLYPDELKTLRDYVKYTDRLKQALRPHIVDLLKQGLSVALDFPANTKQDRAWMQGIYKETDITHELHYLNVPDEACKERLHQRNQSGQHHYTVSEEQFNQFTAYFQRPSKEEGFNVIQHDFQPA
ncbi:AAA family ATPase [Flexibacterium corallicola]|uniref:AAA family ATPase n=1 Tax=Flexibacterium corallicola TaxID=3037259 RepID=UPI00286EB6F0|nr:ATP-binding protein [Pseudovibrio sp. M1P-2-3]